MHSFSELVQLFEDKFKASLPFAVAPSGLYDPCRYLLQEGGKRIRPVLCLMGNELFDGISEDAWHAAFGIELFHNFTLIHDDIMDNAPLRRGRPSLHAQYGLTAGILCGDVMSIYSYDHLAQVKTSLPEVLHLFNKTAIQVCEGQQLDMDFEKRDDVSVDDYIEMITLKTSVLLACSLKMGAIIGGGLGDSTGKLYEFGKNMGISFQLQDDYLDAFGDPARLGKQNGGDIRENKKTYLYIKAMAGASVGQKKRIAELSGQNNDAKVNEMLSVFRSAGADEECRKAVAHYSTLAFNCLEDLAIPSKRKQPLLELATYLLQRDK